MKSFIFVQDHWIDCDDECFFKVQTCEIFFDPHIASGTIIWVANMTATGWSFKQAEQHINQQIKNVNDPEVVDYTREIKSLSSIPLNKGYLVDGVHIYIDVLNIDEMLDTSFNESETCHQRVLKFLHLHYRLVDRVLESMDGVRRIDFHNQRLHAVITKPYGNEKERVLKAIAVAHTIIKLVASVKPKSDKDVLPAAKLRVGIDTGQAIAVNNGRAGKREPLFLGNPANHAAKIAAKGKAQGIFLTNEAREAIGLDRLEAPENSKLTQDQIVSSLAELKSEINCELDSMLNTFIQEYKDTTLSSFSFSRSTPPLKNLDLLSLTPANSRRMEAVSIYADIDGFTNYVSQHIDENPEQVVVVLHVLRSEMERVLTNDFGGRRIRFIGDCLHGILCEGTSQKTDMKETVSSAVLCTAALRSSFNLALERLNDYGYDTTGLGLQIGIEIGDLAISRMGLHGERKARCCIGRAVLQSEVAQLKCRGNETAIGSNALNLATDAVREIFNKGKAIDYDYDVMTEVLASAADETAKKIKTESLADKSDLVKRSNAVELRPHVSPFKHE